ncbi:MULTISPECIES: hypothetical protein [unclassified Rhizobium]|uniref:hypothetical protein n=1 Tax=unclassified Rhizobium TaxID=2613769 RepID=UPI00160D5DD0|nr:MULTISPECIES: hypothetical protein [unclassified Rhizobium]MBB3297832.1 ribosomal protein L40E [Rhizobium sp. BK112]MBB4177673.1 ribosomal protein L40E [Rhizobium sp. BK109]
MSYHVFFNFSQGLSRSVMAPKGTKASVIAHVEDIERRLKLEREQYRDNQVHWKSHGWPSSDLKDDDLCKGVEDHNRWVHWFYDRLEEWAKDPVTNGEEITPDDAKAFWHGLKTLTVHPSRWNGDYYRARMEELYEVMRGRPTAGISFDAAKLSPKQAGAVIHLFEGFLDPQDLRLEVPRGCDHLASSYWGEYDWCERCGAVLPEYSENCRKRGCPVQENWCEEDRPDWWRPVKKSNAPAPSQEAKAP